MVYSRFKFLLEDYGLEEAEKLVVHGQVEGYYTLISAETQSNLYHIMIGAHPSEGAAAITSYFEELEALPTVQSVKQKDTAIIVTGKISIKKDKMIQTIRDILDHFPRKLQVLGYQPGDFKTGINDDTVKLTQFNEYYTYLSEENFQRVVDELKNQQTEFANTKENILLGLLGAFTGATIGGLLWFIVGLMGYFAWIAGILALYLAFKGYQIAGGKVGKLGAVLVFILTILIVFIANHAVWAWTANDGYDEFYWYAFQNIHHFILSDPSLRMNYLIDVALGVGIITLIGIPFTNSLYKENSSNYKIRRQ